MSKAVCPRCGETIPLTAEQIMVSGTKGWWHSECHEASMAEIRRALALRAVAHMHGYRAEKSS
jgi:hypothetical protein